MFKMLSKSQKLYVIGIIVIVTAVAAFSNDWPNWHGPGRTNKSVETGLLKSWPKEGPTLIWTASGIGAGYSGVSTANGVVYTAGAKNKSNVVFAFDHSGKLVWERQVGETWEAKRQHARQYAGSRSTPAIADGVVYYLSDMGVLAALDASTGAVKWSVDMFRKHGAEDMPMYGYSESPLVVGNRLYAANYGKKSTAMCFDKNTGAIIWESERLPGAPGDAYAGYASFVYVENSGFKQLIAFTAGLLYALNAENGQTLWTVPFNNKRNNNCTDIIYHDGHVFATSGYGEGSMLVKLNSDGKGGVKAEEVYRTKLMDNHHGGVILHNGYIYGSGHESSGWHCLDFKTGKQMWNTPGKGSVTFADGMLYFYDENGKMSLVKANHGKFELISSFETPPGGKGAYWAHPVISHGVLYLRHADKLYAYDIKQK